MATARDGKVCGSDTCGHTVIAAKWLRGWVLYFDGGYKLNIRDWPTLAKAKAAAPALLVTLRYGWEKRQADAAAKQRAETDKRVAAVIRRCRIADSQGPPVGLPWHEWAEWKVGCTARDVPAMNAGPTLADLLDEWYADNYAEISVDDVRRMFTEWYFEAIA